MSGVGQAVFMNQRSFGPPPQQLWTWGENSDGQLGRNDLYNFSSPQQVGSLTTWSSIAVGQGSQRTMAAVTSDGKLFTWGENLRGQLGLNTAGGYAYRSSPTQVGALTNWKMVAQGFRNCHAIKTDGTMWAWGYSNNTELGTGTTSSDISSPVQIGTTLTWEFVARGRRVGMAKTTAGDWYVWGYNQSGTLGLGNAGSGTNRSGPTLLSAGAGNSWSIINGGGTQMNAIKTDGTLWGWGGNSRGSIGVGNTIQQSSPVQVGALTNWLSLASFLTGCVAVKTDGTLWTWGYNNRGQLGLGNTVSRSSPLQVGALTNWTAKINAGSATCMAIKGDGTLWAWGQNNFGQLGLGNTTYRSSPVQVGALTTWEQIGFLNNYSSAALKRP